MGDFSTLFLVACFALLICLFVVSSIYEQRRREAWLAEKRAIAEGHRPLSPEGFFELRNSYKGHMLLQQAMEEQRRREREAAERRLYESRRNMWDAEKRLKSAEKALAHEDEREEQAKRVRLQEREDKAARRAGGRVKYGADADKQYE